MLEIKTNDVELFDDDKQEFSTIPGVTLHLEHSLISISKWEATWHKPFMDNADKMTNEEIIDYVKCMTLSSNKIDERVYWLISKENIEKIIAYIQNPMTATWFSDDKKNQKTKREVITSELIYYWMVALQIPFECQKWHLNRLLTLVRVCNAKNEESNPDPKRKPTQRQMMARAAALNAQRQAKYHTKG